MQTISQIRAMLDERGLTPRKRLGQNFLHDKNQLTKLVNAAGVVAGDLVLEIGPGTGTLTEALLDAGAEVIACELDAGLADLIEDRLGDYTALGNEEHASPYGTKHGTRQKEDTDDSRWSLSVAPDSSFQLSTFSRAINHSAAQCGS